MAEKMMQWILCRYYGDKKGKGLTRALLGDGAFATLLHRADVEIEAELNTIAGKVLGGELGGLILSSGLVVGLPEGK